MRILFLPKNLTPSILLFVFFCIDIWMFFLFGIATPLISTSFLFSCIFMNSTSHSFILYSTLLLASACQTMGLSLWWPLVAIAPFFLIILAIQNHVFLNPLYPALAASLSVAIDLFLFRPLLLGKAIPPSYTIWIISSTLLLTTIFSLKLKTGKTGQSLTHG